VREIINGLNRLIPEGEPKLFAPDVKFNRKIGDETGKPYSAEGGLLSVEEHRKHLAEALPGPADVRVLESLFKEGKWLLSVSGNA
jgi:hypothetical protein